MHVSAQGNQRHDDCTWVCERPLLRLSASCQRPAEINQQGSHLKSPRFCALRPAPARERCTARDGQMPPCDAVFEVIPPGFFDGDKKKSQRRQRAWVLFACAAWISVWWGAGAAVDGRTLLACPRRAVPPIHPSSLFPFPVPTNSVKPSSARTLASIDPAAWAMGGAARQRPGGLRCSRHWRASCPWTAHCGGKRHSMDRSSSKQQRLQFVRRRLVLDRYSCCSIQWRTESARSFSWPMIIFMPYYGPV
jgi:hypothetical protein